MKVSKKMSVVTSFVAVLLGCSVSMAYTRTRGGRDVGDVGDRNGKGIDKSKPREIAEKAIGDEAKRIETTEGRQAVKMVEIYGKYGLAATDLIGLNGKFIQFESVQQKPKFGKNGKALIDKETGEEISGETETSQYSAVSVLEGVELLLAEANSSAKARKATDPKSNLELIVDEFNRIAVEQGLTGGVRQVLSVLFSKLSADGSSNDYSNAVTSTLAKLVDQMRAYKSIPEDIGQSAEFLSSVAKRVISNGGKVARASEDYFIEAADGEIQKAKRAAREKEACYI